MTTPREALDVDEVEDQCGSGWHEAACPRCGMEPRSPLEYEQAFEALRLLWRYLEREHGDRWMKAEKREHALRVSAVLGENR